MERFSCETTVISGPGALSVLAERHPGRLFLVTDPDRPLPRTQLPCTDRAVFDRACPVPTTQLAAQGAAELRAFRPDWVVGLGSGGAVDLAKAIFCFSGWEAHLAAVPIGSGAGSEVTDRTALIHRGRRQTLRHPRLLPELAILDDSLLEDLPRPVIADSGFDLLTRAAEAFTAKTAGPFTDCLARDAFSAAFAALPAAFAGSTAVRPRIQIAGAMAGLAERHTGAGLCRTVAGVLQDAFHLPPGLLCAVLLPPVIRRSGAAGKYAQLARWAGLGGGTEAAALRSLCLALERLRQELRLPATLAAAGIDPRQVWQRSRELVEAVLTGTADDPPADFTVRAILDEATGRR